MNRIVIVWLAFSMSAALGILSINGCATSRDARGEGMDPQTLPENVRGDYEVFAQRCSKCHSLARPLNSGIDDDDFWVNYVARMRRQPSSGISQADGVVILRFLRYYSSEQRRIKAKAGKAEGDAGAAIAIVDAAPAIALDASSTSSPSLPVPRPATDVSRPASGGP